jgi:hypothetical protein
VVPRFVIAGLDPAIQSRLLRGCCPWMPGSRPGMTWVFMTFSPYCGAGALEDGPPAEDGFTDLIQAMIFHRSSSDFTMGVLAYAPRRKPRERHILQLNGALRVLVPANLRRLADTRLDAPEPCYVIS